MKNTEIITKSIDSVLKQALFIVSVPDEVDAHGDIMTVAEVRKACFNFNTFCRKANLFHVEETDTFGFAESYVAPTDFTIGNELIKAGTWLATVQVFSDDLWKAIECGDVCGLSIGARGLVENLNEE